MSNNLASQPLSLPSATLPISQYELTPSNIDASRSGMQMPLTNPLSDRSSSQTRAFYSLPMNTSYPMSNGTESLGISVQKLSGQSAIRIATSVPPFFVSPVNAPMGGMAASANNLAVQQQFASLHKRKAPMDSKSSSTSPLMSAAPNKRPTQTEHRPWLLQQSALNCKNVPGQVLYQMPVSKRMAMQNRKLSPLESISTKSVLQHRMLSAKTQNSPRISKESFESVRSKMRESLAGALAQVTQDEGRSPSDVTNSESNTSVTADQQKGDLSTVSIPSPQGDGKDVLRESEQKFGSSEETVRQDRTNGQTGFQKSENADASVSMTHNTPAFQYGGDLLGEDVSFSDNFFVKDDLLQGNGISWVLEAGAEMVYRSDSQATEGERSGMISLGGQGRDSPVQSPEIMASNIEDELFKLFGGVNKKYKEKGRSLLFNLKDRSNPELRERVVSGEIPPDKLCSMSAEELASKELSEWRMAKAEELAQMVVLLDTEVDLKRLVKKTHKGELQVEVEQDEGLSVEVSAGVGITSYRRSRTQEQRSASDKQGETKDNVKVGDEKRNPLGCETPYTPTIPSEDQVSEVDIIEDDATKDLPPIVSLDEFMQSLDSELPFEDLRVNAESTHSSCKKTARIGSKTRYSERSPKDAVDIAEDKFNTNDEARSKLDLSENHMDNDGISDDKLSAVVSKVDHVWEGSLQLNASLVVSIVAYFKSGEKTITKEWTGCPEVKGRVRFDAFEKFLQDLRLSRSRALMVVQLVSKESSPKHERDRIGELADSYITDKRVGIAEPCPGVELYLCPPNDKTRQMLSKVLSEDQIKTLEEVNDGLIGVVLWRRVHPNRHSISSSRKQPHFVSSLKRHASERDVNVVNVNSPYNGPPQRPRFARSPAREAEDDDVPPGFGPGMASQDVDDLPEFNFSDGINHNSGFSSNPTRMTGLHHGHSKTSRPVDQIRELIQKYGQSEGSQMIMGSTGVPVQPWNDHDDIPEWHPGSQTVVAQQSVIAPVTQPHNLYTTYPTTLSTSSAPHTQAARQPAWQDPRWNRGGV